MLSNEPNEIAHVEEQMVTNRLAGIVLCGGRSRRMGTPKEWLPFEGQVLLQRVVGVVATVAEPVIVVAAVGQDVPTLADGVEIVRDPVSDQGPLRGLLTGLDALTGRADRAFLAACDLPFLNTSFITRLNELMGDHSIAVAETQRQLIKMNHRDTETQRRKDRENKREKRHLHLTAAVYRLDVRDPAAQLLAAGRRKLGLLPEHVPTRIVTSEELRDVDPQQNCTRNLNTPEDYAAAMAHDHISSDG